MEYYLEA